MIKSKDVSVGQTFWTKDGGVPVECVVTETRKIWRGVTSYLGTLKSNGGEISWFVGPLYETKEELEQDNVNYLEEVKTN